MTRWAVLLLPVLGILVVDPSPWNFHAVKYFVCMAGAFVCVALGLDARRLTGSQVSVALWIFVAVRGFMLWRSPVSGRALRWWSLLLALTLVHHVACATTTRRWLTRRATPVLAGLAAAIALLALVQSFRLPQAHAFFAHRNFAGAGLAMLLPFALASRWRGPLLLTVLVGLVAIRSRGGALAAAAALALWIVWTRPRWRWPVLAGLPALVLALGLALGRSQTVKVRLGWYEAALAMGLEHPVAGLGADGFAREYPPVRPRWEHRLSRGAQVHAVHDDYLESFAEGGLLGLGAHLFLVGMAAVAVRRHRAAAASLLAFAVASLVDLPLRDPALLALAFLPLTMAARRHRLRVPAMPFAVLALLAIGTLGLHHYHHWRADRLVGPYLRGERRDPAVLDEALGIERRHPEALIERSSPRDLALLLELEPHHAGAHYNRTRDLPEQEAVAALEEILEKHDPHHALSQRRLAQFRTRRTLRRAREAEALLADEPLRAASLLERLVAEDPEPYLPHLLMARLHREAGRQDRADRWLQQAEAREYNAEVARERLAFERIELKQSRWAPTRLVRALRYVPPAEVAGLIEAALARAREIEAAHPPPQVPRDEGEDPVAYARRIDEIKEGWRRRRDGLTRSDYLEALLLADALASSRPSIEHFRLLGRAARGMRDLDRARQAEALALFAEALEALAQANEPRARSRLARALRAYPDLDRERSILALLALFAADRPDALPAARRLLREHPRLARALEK
ncbi:MAG: O-antigen ligase family protein [Planctomycetota bacterium]